jgi:class 3 adenylate cyclase
VLDAVPEERTWLTTLISELAPTGWAVEIYDREWQLLWVSDELSKMVDGPIDLGARISDLYQQEQWRQMLTEDSAMETKLTLERYLSGELPMPPVFSYEIELNTEVPTRVQVATFQITEVGRLAGYVRIYGPGLPASVLSVVAQGDTQQFELMTRFSEPGQRPAAIMFADLEGSTSLARQLPSATYFRFISSLTLALDEVILSHDGLIGKHSGDGVSAFFISEEHGGAASAATRAAIVCAGEAQDRLSEIAEQFIEETGMVELRESRLNVGLHWGSTLYIGQVASAGRLEVTALGDEVNDTARIEEVAKQGAILASKPLLERLSPDDAEYLGLEPEKMTYQVLADINDQAKAHRDRINIPVAEISLRK